MFATTNSKKAVVALLLLGALTAPAEAKGWKFHVLGTKVELGNRGPITIRPTPTSIPDPNLLGAALVINGVSGWLTAPEDIRKSINNTNGTINEQGNKFYNLIVEFIAWIKGLITSYGLAILLGFAAVIFTSAIAAAFIIGNFIRSGLLRKQFNPPETAA